MDLAMNTRDACHRCTAPFALDDANRKRLAEPGCLQTDGMATRRNRRSERRLGTDLDGEAGGHWFWGALGASSGHTVSRRIHGPLFGRELSYQRLLLIFGTAHK
jgi:hypothetical protein